MYYIYNYTVRTIFFQNLHTIRHCTDSTGHHNTVQCSISISTQYDTVQCSISEVEVRLYIFARTTHLNKVINFGLTATLLFILLTPAT